MINIREEIDVYLNTLVTIDALQQGTALAITQATDLGFGGNPEQIIEEMRADLAKKKQKLLLYASSVAEDNADEAVAILGELGYSDIPTGGSALENFIQQHIGADAPAPGAIGEVNQPSRTRTRQHIDVRHGLSQRTDFVDSLELEWLRDQFKKLCDENSVDTNSWSNVGALEGKSIISYTWKDTGDKARGRLVIRFVTLNNQTLAAQINFQKKNKASKANTIAGVTANCHAVIEIKNVSTNQIIVSVELQPLINPSTEERCTIFPGSQEYSFAPEAIYRNIMGTELVKGILQQKDEDDQEYILTAEERTLQNYWNPQRGERIKDDGQYDRDSYYEIARESKATEKAAADFSLARLPGSKLEAYLKDPSTGNEWADDLEKLVRFDLQNLQEILEYDFGIELQNLDVDGRPMPFRGKSR